MLWLSAPGVAAWLWPLATSLVVTGAIRLAAGRERGPRLAGIGAGAVILVSIFILGGPPGLAAATFTQQIVVLTLAGLAVGAFLDVEAIGGWPRRVTLIVLPIAGLMWVTAQASASATFPDRNVVVALFGAAALATGRINRVKGSAMTAPILVALAALGLAWLSWIAATFAMVQINLAIAGAIGGYLLWNWPVFRFAPGAALTLASSAPLLAMAGGLTLIAGIDRLALAVLGLVFFSDWIAGLIPLGGGRIAHALRPLLVIAAGLLIAAAAALLAVR